uniref:Uncharacterized protein n=1 Tax=Eutreptiella gymnastica TaxID=73025 RepID=A0A7S4CLY0_9EUGL
MDCKAMDAPHGLVPFEPSLTCTVHPLPDGSCGPAVVPAHAAVLRCVSGHVQQHAGLVGGSERREEIQFPSCISRKPPSSPPWHSTTCGMHQESRGPSHGNAQPGSTRHSVDSPSGH